MTTRLVSDGEFSEVVTDHVGLDFDLDEVLSVVHTDLGSDHFGDDDHVTKVSLDHLGLFVLVAILFVFVRVVLSVFLGVPLLCCQCVFSLIFLRPVLSFFLFPVLLREKIG